MALPRVLLGVAFILVWPWVTLPAQPAIYSLGELETYPGAQMALPFSVSNASAWNALAASLSYDHFKATVQEIHLVGALGAVTPEFVATFHDENAGRITLDLILDGSAPFDTVLAPGTDQEVAHLIVDVSQGLLPGQFIAFGFVDGFGSPPVANVAAAAGVVVVPVFEDGGITISSQNFLIFPDTHAAPGDLLHAVPIVGINVDNVMGFQVVATYEHAYFHGRQLTITDTITAVVGAEYVQTIINNDEGYFILGVLLDLIPPYHGQTIPASQLALPFARFLGDVLPAAEAVDTIDLSFQDGLGTPPVENIFVIANRSVAPQKIDGQILIDNRPVFVRGDANMDRRVDKSDAIVLALYVFNMWSNPVCLAALDVDDDTRINLADAIYLLSYLFVAGSPIPAPFPLAGIDPTPPYLPCEN